MSVQPPHFKWALLIFFTLGILGVGILIGLAFVDETLSESQKGLSQAGDWMMKTNIGAIAGLFVDRRLR